MTSIRRVFISHTSELRTFPERKSFIGAAIDAVIRAQCVPCDMEYFTARDDKPAQYCLERVRECDVYVGVIGSRYGSPVRDRPDVSYTELEFEGASKVPAKPRLIFLLDPDAQVPHQRFTDLTYGTRQQEFRKRLSDAGVMCKPFSDVHELEKLIYQALIDESGRGAARTPLQERLIWDEQESPYPGLFAFDEHYAPLFFGRDREVDEILTKMSDREGRFLLISGASGSGKSSLVAAGVWRALLKEGRLAGSNDWVWARIQPGDEDSPFGALARGLKRAFPRLSTHAPELTRQLAGGQTTLEALLASCLPPGQEFVLYLDQLEELLTQNFKREEVETFLARLVTPALGAQNRLRVLATVRSEFIVRLEESEAMLHVLNAGSSRHHVGPVSPRILQDMIERPAQATGYQFEPGLVEDILREAALEPGSLPLVAYALAQLFERRRKRTFTREAYKAIGGVAGAIGTKADHAMQTLGEPGRAFNTVFAELVHIERDRPPTRKRVAQATFTDDTDAMRLIGALAAQDCRVLTTGAHGSSVEVAHEKLFTGWPRLKAWIDRSGETLRLIDHAGEAARRWEQRENRVEELWSGAAAAEVSAALHRFGKQASPELARFLTPQAFLEKQIEHDSLSHADRLRIGSKLSEFGDTREGVGLTSDGLPDIKWVEIPPGRIRLEDIDHAFEVTPFRIAKYPVTNAQFEAFIRAEDGYGAARWWKGIQRSEAPAPPSWQEANCPRETVSWFEAVAFCRWLSARTGTTIRLPAEWEWQQAATGGGRTHEYPWPGGWDASRCNGVESRLNRTTAVGMYPNGATQQGVLDMAGNVWEWCLNTYEQPDIAEAVRLTDDPNNSRVIRGGSWNDVPGGLRASFWTGSVPTSGTTLSVSVLSRTFRNPLYFVL